MKKRELVVSALALAGSVASMVSMEASYAAVGCSTASASTPTVCTGTTGGFLAEGFSFTGSNGVTISATDDATTGIAVCGSQLSGRNAYGLTTAGGSMESKSGTAVTNGAGGCS